MIFFYILQNVILMNGLWLVLMWYFDVYYGTDITGQSIIMAHPDTPGLLLSSNPSPQLSQMCHEKKNNVG